MQSAAQLDPLVANEAPMKWMLEVGDAGLDLGVGFILVFMVSSPVLISSFDQVYLESKAMQDGPDTQQWIDRIWCEPTAQSTFARLVSKVGDSRRSGDLMPTIFAPFTFLLFARDSASLAHWRQWKLSR